MQLRLSRNLISRLRQIAPRVVAVGFLFFLIKGLVWLGLGAAAIMGVLWSS